MAVLEDLHFRHVHDKPQHGPPKPQRQRYLISNEAARDT